MAQCTVWQKSSFSGGGDSSDCVEIAAAQEALLLRESDRPATVLRTTPPQLALLIRHLRTH
ncbi:DUF397 domain-containing protein [Streptomyces sp. V3I7]|uniref:DUF397 domain-containing protein n=1 Tax=Streptomyces sp. V3I7 TaxID=3042278 RepID=UPI002787332C|nr:DUF397 domain-containing protein [Streptomyces sp. V3I7]MDQ0992013.1 hypothetical protein [Streptomyces sp. V3I7]